MSEKYPEEASIYNLDHEEPELSRLTSDQRRYLELRLGAEKHRLEGNIVSAIQLERKMYKIYSKLPKELRCILARVGLGAPRRRR